MPLIKIGRIFNIILLTTLLVFLLPFFIESYRRTPETYVFLIYPALIEILILLFGITLLLFGIKHKKKTYPDILIFYFLTPALVFIAVLLGDIGTIMAICVIIFSVIIQTKKLFKPNNNYSKFY